MMFSIRYAYCYTNDTSYIINIVNLLSTTLCYLGKDMLILVFKLIVSSAEFMMILSESISVFTIYAPCKIY